MVSECSLSASIRDSSVKRVRKKKKKHTALALCWYICVVIIRHYIHLLSMWVYGRVISYMYQEPYVLDCIMKLLNVYFADVIPGSAESAEDSL